MRWRKRTPADPLLQARPRASNRPPVKPADFIADHPVFRFNEFRAAHAASGASPLTTRALLKYHVKAGRILNVRRGLYARDAGVDPFLLASRLSADAVIGYEGAFAYWHYGELEHALPVLTATPFLPQVWSEIVMSAVTVPRALRKTWAKDFGGEIREERVTGLLVRVTSRERTFVDLLDRLPDEYELPLKHLFRSLKEARGLDVDQMIAHAVKLKSAVCAARLGVFLQAAGRAQLSELKALRNHVPSNPVYFRRGEKGQSLFSPWNVLCPIWLGQVQLRNQYGLPEAPELLALDPAPRRTF